MNRIGFSQRLELRQSQALVMTPQLQQAIKMLQLSNIELAEFVDGEIEQNPLLEPGETDPDAAPIAATEAGVKAANGTPAAVADALPAGLEGDVAGDAAEHWAAAGGEDGDGSFDRGGEGQLWHNGGGYAGDDQPGIENAAARARTLREHLVEQIGADLPDIADRVIAFYLLDQLDENGYLRLEIDAAERLGCTSGQVERVLARLQEFDPPGVFARDLAECLALQLRDRDRLDPAMQALLANLPLLAARNAAGADAAMRGRRRGPRRHGRRDPRARPAAGHRFRRAPGAAGHSRHSDAAAAARRLADRAEPRHAAAGAGQQPLLRPGHPAGAQ